MVRNAVETNPSQADQPTSLFSEKRLKSPSVAVTHFQRGFAFTYSTSYFYSNASKPSYSLVKLEEIASSEFTLPFENWSRAPCTLLLLCQSRLYRHRRGRGFRHLRWSDNAPRESPFRADKMVPIPPAFPLKVDKAQGECRAAIRCTSFIHTWMIKCRMQTHLGSQPAHCAYRQLLG